MPRGCSRRRFRAVGLVFALLCSGAVFGSCRGREQLVSGGGELASPEEPLRRPKPELLESLRQDLALERHPADGGGRAWLDPSPPPARVSTPGTWVIVYQAGELGIAEGGMIYLQVSPFWGWSTPQVERPDAPGYTQVTTDAAGVELTSRTLDQQLLGIAVGGSAMAAGERVRIVYGAGIVGSRADRFAERGSRFWIAVDGDGDGVRAVLADSPSVDVEAAAPSMLVATGPSTARPGDTVRLTLAFLDGLGNAGAPVDGTVRLLAPAGVVAPESVRLRPADRGRKTVDLMVNEPGVVRVMASGPGGLTAESNPLQVSPQGSRVLWGDLQNHSNASDGTAVPEDQFHYARDVAALDVMALTDHDHWGLLFLDQQPEIWSEIGELTRRFHQPGRFVTLLGYEWTSWIHGHRHVLFFDDDGPLLSSVDPAYDEPAELWHGLRGRRALTLAHHSAGGPVSTDWSIAPDPELEPVTEIVSVHGSSEADDSPFLIHRPVAGNFVRDALGRGYRLGFLGSSDGHDGHPGLGHLASPSGGLAAILAEDLTREGVYQALKARRVYATSGPRILLRVSFGGHRMGAEIPVGSGSERGTGEAVPGIGVDTLVARVIAPAALSLVDVVRSGRVVESVDCAGERECAFGAAFPDLEPGEYLYVRAVQENGGAAWSSPFFFVASGAAAQAP
ncbi:MAG: DUF3604 domain-containing protein [bacterium]|nr:DUF3604 domain-containing protein [bacterium]